MQLGGRGAGGILRDHDRVIVLPRLAGGLLDAKIGRDSAQDDRGDPAAPQLGIQLGAVEGAAVALKNNDVTRVLLEGRMEIRPFRRRGAEAGIG